MDLKFKVHGVPGPFPAAHPGGTPSRRVRCAARSGCRPLSRRRFRHNAAVIGQVRSQNLPRPAPSERAFRGGDAFYLPNFCASRAAFAIVVVAELTAIVVSIARSAAQGFWSELALSSLFLLWVVLMSAALLCVLRPLLARLGEQRGSSVALALMTAVVAAVSASVFLLGHSHLVRAAGANALFPRRLGPFVMRNTAIGFVIAAVTLRYFYVTHQWRRNIELRAAARVHALQARIRPHFLFNSMNTIAALTRTAPREAEQAVQDLADLFRASLAEPLETITLADELEIARTYQRIEQLRLGERLRVVWRVEALPLDARVPGLLLQPLLENAIYHGIEPRPAGGIVEINGERAGELLSLVVRNPLGARAREHEGNQLALQNIRERLTLHYGARALLKAGRFDEEYIVTLRFPYIPALAPASGARS